MVGNDGVSRKRRVSYADNDVTARGSGWDAASYQLDQDIRNRRIEMELDKDIESYNRREFSRKRMIWVDEDGSMYVTRRIE